MVFTVEGNKDELVVSLAAMILNDGKADLTESNLNSVISAAGASCAPHFPKAFGIYLILIKLRVFVWALIENNCFNKHASMHTQAHTHTHTCTHAHTYTYTHNRTRTHTHALTRIHVPNAADKHSFNNPPLFRLHDEIITSDFDPDEVFLMKHLMYLQPRSARVLTWANFSSCALVAVVIFAWLMTQIVEAFEKCLLLSN